jgi:hypothetical protein
MYCPRRRARNSRCVKKGPPAVHSSAPGTGIDRRNEQFLTAAYPKEPCLGLTDDRSPSAINTASVGTLPIIFGFVHDFLQDNLNLDAVPAAFIISYRRVR